MPSQAEQPVPRAPRALRWALPVVLWAFATLFLWGELGLWNDDLTFSTRDPETGQFETLRIPQRNPETGGYQFWRPLHFLTTAPIQTLLWDFPHARQLLQAIAHGLVALLVAAFVRALGRSRAAATGAGLLFLVYPVHHQAVFWTSALSTTLATGLAMVALILYVGVLRGTRSRWWGSVIPLLAFASACYNEQPTALLWAMPILAFALTPRGHGLVRTIRDAVLIPGLCALALGAYAALYILTSDGRLPGTSANSFMLSIDALAAEAQRVARDARGWLLMRSFHQGALPFGIEMLLDRPWRALMFAGAMSIAIVPWVSQRAEPHEPVALGVRTGLWTAVYAMLAVVFAFLPVVLIREYQVVDSRLLYAPAVAVVLLVAVVIDACRAVPTPARARDALGRVSAFALLIVLLLGSSMLVGVQGARAARWSRDLALAEQLRTVIPEPPEGLYLFPAYIDDRATHTGRWRFDDSFWSPLAFPWAGFQYLQRVVYQRRALYSGFVWLWDNPQPVTGADERALRVRYEMDFLWPYGWDPATGESTTPAMRARPDGHVIWWSRVVPMGLERDGSATFYPFVRLERADNDDAVILMPMLAPALAQGLIEPRTLPVYDRWRDDRVEPVLGWLDAGGREILFARAAPWRSTHTGAPMGDGEVWSVMLKPRDRATRAHFRVTIPPEDAARLTHADGFRVEAFAGGVLAGSIEVRAGELIDDGGWRAFSAEIPASDEPIRLELRAARLAAPRFSDAPSPRVLVTHGLRDRVRPRAEPEINENPSESGVSAAPPGETDVSLPAEAPR